MKTKQNPTGAEATAAHDETNLSHVRYLQGEFESYELRRHRDEDRYVLFRSRRDGSFRFTEFTAFSPSWAIYQARIRVEQAEYHEENAVPEVVEMPVTVYDLDAEVPDDEPDNIVELAEILSEIAIAEDLADPDPLPPEAEEWACERAQVIANEQREWGHVEIYDPFDETLSEPWSSAASRRRIEARNAALYAA